MEPQRGDFETEAEYCRAMQRWLRDELAVDHPLRILAIGDWFAEEMLSGD